MLESAGLTVKSLEMIYYRGHPSSMPALFRCVRGQKLRKSDGSGTRSMDVPMVLPPIIFGGKNDLIQL